MTSHNFAASPAQTTTHHATPCHSENRDPLSTPPSTLRTQQLPPRARALSLQASEIPTQGEARLATGRNVRHPLSSTLNIPARSSGPARQVITLACGQAQECPAAKGHALTRPCSSVRPAHLLLCSRCRCCATRLLLREPTHGWPHGILQAASARVARSPSEPGGALPRS